MTKPQIPDVLASRYASEAMARIWSPEHKVVLERQLWLAVLEAQRELGLDVPQQVIDDYRAVIDHVDLDSIAARERVTRHDVKARIEEFCALAGHEHIHKGMTSRDLTENVEQLQVRSSLRAGPRRRRWRRLAGSATSASEHATLVMAGRSHNVAAQATTLGKRFATAADEMLVAYDAARRPDRPLPAARHQGSGGHRQDMLDLLDGDASKVAELEIEIVAASRLRAGPRQRRPGLPAIARLRRRHVAGAARGRRRRRWRRPSG